MKIKRVNKIKFTFWKAVSILIAVIGIYSLIMRFTKGLGATTHLNDHVPWGLWIGFDFIGVGLAAAGFTIAATAHIFNNHKYESIARPAILTAFIGYMMVVALLVIDLGKPENFWHPLVMWNVHSVMFEITWCVICYSTVLTIEFAPVLLEKFKLVKIQKLVKKITIPVIICGVLFSTLHQSSFGSLYLIVPAKVYPLWYSSYLPLHFFISCIAAGLSMIIFESYLCARAFNRGLNISILSGLAKGVLTAILTGAVLKFADIASEGKIPLLFSQVPETYAFWFEIIVGTVVPVIILTNHKWKVNRTGLYFASIFAISGFILNRMNVCVTSLVQSSGQHYRPSFEEISITLFLVLAAMIAFKLTVENFQVFEKEERYSNLVSSKHEILSKNLVFNKQNEC
ncbi:MAG TPA: NrfD/PsrC family molybdoenzyme membrane anchor subunit [Ignavibacteriaceae bacterium]|nr:NrfD/PsrC family molybdoenzyme membrane anchor subunit [Ignavibacteriaceae bacterium]